MNFLSGKMQRKDGRSISLTSKKMLVESYLEAGLCPSRQPSSGPTVPEGSNMQLCDNTAFQPDRLFDLEEQKMAF